MQASSSGPGGTRNSIVLPFIVAATFFMEYLDTTIIATALPQMARSFRVGPNEVSLGMTAYMLTLAVFIPISGWIADRCGARKVFASAVLVFTLASALCGFSTSVLTFTAARVLQGMGGAMMVPVGRMIVVRNTDPGHMMRAISTITWPGIVAPVVGPTVGGFITTYASWHWVFFLNLPFGLAALAAIVAFVPDQQGQGARKLDAPGFLLCGVALVSLLYGMELASQQEASLASAAGFLAAGIAVGLVAIAHLLKTAHPILNLAVFRTRSYATAVLWGSIARAGIESVPYLSPLLFQIGFGLSAFHSGLLLLITASGNLGMKIFVNPIMRRFGFRTVIVVNGVVVALTMLAFVWMTPGTPAPVLYAVLFAYGIARSLQLSTMSTLSFADIPEPLKSSSSTVWSTMQQVSIGMGIAFGAVCLRMANLAHASGDSTGYSQFTVADFHWAFAITALVTVLPTFVYRRLPHDAGRSITHAASKPSAARSMARVRRRP